MKKIDPEKFHKLYGVKKPRISFQSKDFFDYCIMTALSLLVVCVSYGFNHVMSIISAALCFIMIFDFLVRHGFELSMPVIFKRPQDTLYMLIHKLQNIKAMYFLAVFFLVVENYIIYLTPSLPHKVELAREIAIYLFFIHFVSISIYRSLILIAHLYKKNQVREILMKTAWRGVISKHPSIVFEILHAYFTGVLTHIILIAPWYIVITHLNFSIIFFPAVFIINVIIHIKFIQGYSAWFYRDHWLSHNSEFEFLYLHGTHHDAIPSGLIGVSGNGHLEGFMRHILGNPTPYYNPVVAFLLYSLEVFQDIKNHQYIPDVFPKLSREFHEACQHSTHHFGRLEPYGIALKSSARPNGVEKWLEFPPYELLNSIMLDEQLTGFEWDNARYRQFLKIFDDYQGK